MQLGWNLNGRAASSCQKYVYNISNSCHRSWSRRNTTFDVGLKSPRRSTSSKSLNCTVILRWVSQSLSCEEQWLTRCYKMLQNQNDETTVSSNRSCTTYKLLTCRACVPCSTRLRRRRDQRRRRRACWSPSSQSRTSGSPASSRMWVVDFVSRCKQLFCRVRKLRNLSRVSCSRWGTRWTTTKDHQNNHFHHHPQHCHHCHHHPGEPQEDKHDWARHPSRDSQVFLETFCTRWPNGLLAF